MSVDFYSTVGGKRFIEGTMPRIASALERIADRLEATENDEHVEKMAKLLSKALFPALAGEKADKEGVIK